MNKIVIGSKNLIVKDPEYLNELIQKGIFIPVCRQFKTEEKTKNILYNCELKDTNTNRNLKVCWILPQGASDSLSLGPPSQYDTGLSLIWESNNDISLAYKNEINKTFGYWFDIMKRANSLGEEIQSEPKSLTSRTYLKWPWKKTNPEEYFIKFNSADQCHKIMIGVGYFNPEYYGISLQLSNFPDLSPDAQQKKRKRTRDADEVDDKKDGGDEIIGDSDVIPTE